MLLIIVFGEYWLVIFVEFLKEWNVEGGFSICVWLGVIVYVCYGEVNFVLVLESVVYNLEKK